MNKRTVKTIATTAYLSEQIRQALESVCPRHGRGGMTAYIETALLEKFERDGVTVSAEDERYKKVEAGKNETAI